jgi:hypothetical protein
VAGFAAVLACPGVASAQLQPKETVSSLLKRGFTVIAAVPALGGTPGLVLQKEQQVFICFVAETPTSPTISTRYCKPVE